MSGQGRDRADELPTRTSHAGEVGGTDNTSTRTGFLTHRAQDAPVTYTTRLKVRSPPQGGYGCAVRSRNPDWRDLLLR